MGAGVILGISFAAHMAVTGSSAESLAGSCRALALFWIAAAALCVLQAFVTFGQSRLAFLGHRGKLAFYILLMIVIGSCSLGFVNLTLPLLCLEARPASEAHAGGMVMLLGFALGAVLTQISTGREFVVCAVASLVAAALMSAGMW